MNKKKITLADLHSQLREELKKSDTIAERIRILNMLRQGVDFVESIECHPRREKLVYWACFFRVVEYLVSNDVITMTHDGLNPEKRKGIHGVLLRLMNTCDHRLRN